MPNQNLELEDAERELGLGAEVDETGAVKKRRGKVVTPSSDVGNLHRKVVGATVKSADEGEAAAGTSLTMTPEFKFACERIYINPAPVTLGAKSRSRLIVTSIKFQGKEQIVGSGYLPADLFAPEMPDPGIEWPSVDGKGDIVIGLYNEDTTVHIAASACCVGLIAE